MAKNIILKAPFKFVDSIFDKQNFFDINYIMKYKECNEKGEYLYYDKLQYKLIEGFKELDKAWFATKWNRFNMLKELPLKDKNNNSFFFCIPDSLQSKIYKISELSRLGITPTNDIKNQFLISSLIVEESINSSQLEGASTTRKVAKEIISREIKPRNSDEEMIINNYLLMCEVKRVKDEELSIDMILEFHSIATNNNIINKNIAGVFIDGNDIFIGDNDGNTIYMPPKSDEIVHRIKSLCDFANAKHTGENGSIFIDPIVKAIILHFMIGYIHPFNNGNGRVARAIFYWYMLKNKFDYFEYISISKLLKKAPKQYAISYLHSEIDDNDLTYFIDYQLKIILRAIDELMIYLETKSQEFEEILQLLENSSLSKLNFVEKSILKKAIKNPGIIFNAKKVSLEYFISPTTARDYLKNLLKLKLLIGSKNGKALEFISPYDLLDRIKEF